MMTVHHQTDEGLLMSEITGPWAGVDFHRLADKFQGYMADLIHHVPPGAPTLHGRDLHAEALRRTVTGGGSGLESSARRADLVKDHTIIDRAARESAERYAASLAAQLVTAKADALAEAATELERIANNPNVSVPMGKLRTEGWLRAASTIAGWAHRERSTAARGIEHRGDTQ
jgi:hypothetical protein